MLLNFGFFIKKINKTKITKTNLEQHLLERRRFNADGCDVVKNGGKETRRKIKMARDNHSHLKGKSTSLILIIILY